MAADPFRHHPARAHRQRRGQSPDLPSLSGRVAGGVVVLAYSLEELLAEKTRALWERTRPRDAYDVLFLLQNDTADVDLDRARSLFALKCRAKGFEPPVSAALVARVRADEELRSEWTNMLAHQLPQLPDVGGVVERIASGLLEWIDRAAAAGPPQLRPVAAPAGDVPLPASGLRFWGEESGSTVETIRFAGANRLHVEFEYHAKHRVVEPYSLRRARAGNVLLYGWELASAQIKAFDLGKTFNLRVATSSFQPRYAIEVGLGRVSSIPPVARSTQGSAKPPQWRGPGYVYECTTCGRRFLHKTRRGRMRKHKDESGYPCPGRGGYHVETVY